MIPIEKEPKNLPGVELCHFCHNITRYWHLATNTPVCFICANSRNVDEISKRQEGE